MKVLAINGSPHAKGNTAAAIELVADALRQEGVEVEVVQVGNQPVRSCIDCRKCRERADHHCVFDDIVNVCIDKAQDCDGFIFGSPTYYAGMSGAMKSFMDRLFFTGALPPYKVGMAVSAVRRTGGLDVYHQINNFMDITNFIRVPLPYWSVVYGNRDGDMISDEEGVSVMRTAGKQMAWLMKSLAFAKDAVPMPELPQRRVTNFIR
jgi:multimeric flavodoxin WrbA